MDHDTHCIHKGEILVRETDRNMDVKRHFSFTKFTRLDTQFESYRNVITSLFYYRKSLYGISKFSDSAVFSCFNDSINLFKTSP